MMGDANASIPTPQPVIQRPMYAAYGKALSKSSITFISQAAYEGKVHEKLGLRKNDSSCPWNPKINEKRHEAKL